MSTIQSIYLTFFIAFFSSCSFKKTPQTIVSKNADTLLLIKYRNEIITSEYSEEDSTMTIADIEANWMTGRLDGGEIKYAPDNSFKIITFIWEHCGAYCNSAWYSWIHYNLKGKEQIKKVDFYTVDTIYQLPEKKYLIIGSHAHRPASVFTVSCITPNLVSFAGNSLIMHKIEYKNQKTENNSFEFCHNNGADIDNEPYIIYDDSSKILRYRFANNYLYSDGLEIDTIRQGNFIYSKGNFILEKEIIQVLDYRTLPIK